MKIPTRKELQARHSKAVRHCKALDIAITELMLVAAAPPSVVHSTYSKAAMKALLKVQKLILQRK
jgi:hypothetical protein